METKCIYCNSSEELSVSDIIPDSMTVAKLKMKNVCKTHNNLTNTRFENTFANYYSFFRNRLGYLDRRSGKEIRFKADIYANNSLVLRNCSITSLRTFFESKVKSDGKGNYHLVGVKPEYTKILNPNISYKVKINWEELFLSDVAQRTIAKICYEFHCFNNHINQKEERYNDIIAYILETDKKLESPVEVIDDPIFDNITKSAFNYIEGAHGLFEYSDNGKRYVVCSLFGTVWYRTTICDDFKSEFEKTMRLFLLDGTVSNHVNSSVVVPCSLDGTIGELQHSFLFSIHTIKIEDIEDVKAFLEPKTKIMTELVNGAIITINQFKNYEKLLFGIHYENFDIAEIKKIILHQENIKIMALMMFCAISDLAIKKYKEKAFLDCCVKEYSGLSKKAESILFSDTFISKVKEGINKFNYLLASGCVKN